MADYKLNQQTKEQTESFINGWVINLLADNRHESKKLLITRFSNKTIICSLLIKMFLAQFFFKNHFLDALFKTIL